MCPHTPDSRQARPTSLARKREPHSFRIPRTKAERKRQNIWTLSFPFPSIPHAFYRKNLSRSARAGAPKTKPPPRAQPAAVADDERICRLPPPMAEGSSRRVRRPSPLHPPRSPGTVRFLMGLLFRMLVLVAGVIPSGEAWCWTTRTSSRCRRRSPLDGTPSARSGSGPR